MTDRPILMSAPMVNAIMREIEKPGTGKTQTRRPALRRVPDPADDILTVTVKTSSQRIAAGDKLWVRETWADVNTDSGPALLYRAGGYHFCCDDAFPVEYERYPGCHFTMWCGDLLRGEQDHPWRTPIFMPKWASRLTLTVREARVERLHDITESDAIAEGVVEREESGFWVPGVEHPNKDFPYLARPTAREMFAALWDSIHGSGAWLRNPLVVVVKFSPALRNIDRETA